MTTPVHPGYTPPVAPTRPSNQTNLLLLIIPAIIVIALAVAFITAGDTATGVGRAGWVLLAGGGLCLISLGIIQLQKGPRSGSSSLWLGIGGALCLVLGLGGIVFEGSLHQSQADNYKQSGRYEQAVSEYRKAGNDNLKTNIPEAYLLQGDQLVRQASATAGSGVSSVLLPTDQTARDKKFEQALESYRKVSDPEFTPNTFTETAKKQIGAAYLAWGTQLESTGQKVEDVLAKYDAAVNDANNPTAVDSARNQARALLLKTGDNQLAANNFEQALATYQQAATRYGATDSDIKPYLSKTYLAWGQQLLTGGDFNGAIFQLEPNLKNATESDAPNYTQSIVAAYAGNGKKLVDGKKFDEAVTTLTPPFNTYGKQDSKGQLQDLLRQAYSGQGATAEAAKDYSKALASYEKALTFAPQGSSARADLNQKIAGIYIVQGEGFTNNKDFGRAIDSYEKALGFNTNAGIKTELSGRLGNLYLAQGDSLTGQNQFQKAIDTLKLGQQRYPNPALDGQVRGALAKAYLNWGASLEAAGNFQEALSKYQTILKDYSDQPDFTGPASDAQPRVLYGQAGKYADSKQYDQAIKTYQEIIDKYGGSSVAGQARALLTASQDVTISVVDNNNIPISNLKIKLDEKWVHDPNGDYTTSGQELNFTTDANGKFTVKLTPNQQWLLSYFKDGGYVVITRGDTGQPRNLVSASPLRATAQEQKLTLYR